MEITKPAILSFWSLYGTSNLHNKGLYEFTWSRIRISYKLDVTCRFSLSWFLALSLCFYYCSSLGEILNSPIDVYNFYYRDDIFFDVELRFSLLAINIFNIQSNFVSMPTILFDIELMVYWMYCSTFGSLIYV